MRKTKNWIIGFLGAMVMAWLGNYFYDKTKDIPVLNYITGFLNWIYVLTSNILNFQIKVWIVLALLLIIVGLLALYDKIKASKEVPPPDFTYYKKDIFKRWIWRWEWKWTGEYWTPVNLTPYCPNDDVHLINNGGFIHKSYYCPKCNTEYNEYREPLETATEAEVLLLDKVKKKNYSKD